MIEIVPAQRGEALENFITLSHEYVLWMVTEIQQHYPELDLAEFTSEHDYDDLRQKFPGEHVPPDGCLLVAMRSGEAAGCVALGRLSVNIAEMRTLFVRPAFRGTGVGRHLVEAALGEARLLGYEYIRLDTLGFMTGAQTLYRSFGFYDIQPYRDLSASLRPYIVFLEMALSG